MKTRSKYFKRRHIRNIFTLWIKEWLFNTTVAIVLAATILLVWRVFNPHASFIAQTADIAALKVPPQAISNLYYLAKWYDLPFDQVFAMYVVANDFFFKGTPDVVDIDTLKREYVAGFNRLRRRYAARDIRPYFKMFSNLINELEYFPVPQGYEYMFSDTWGHIKGTAILDRKNIRGRIPVLSMSEGEIKQAGWHINTGYHVVIITKNGSRILYAHLDSLEENIIPGGQVAARQKLGAMGSSGGGEVSRPVHLHIAISPLVSFAQDFWINPYPFLRHMEEKNVYFPFIGSY